MAKEAASRTLDYRLRTDTLDRVKGAGEASLRQKDDIMPGDALAQAGATVGGLIQYQADEKEKKRKEGEFAIESWEAGMSAVRSRQSEYTTGTYAQYQEVEEGQKAIYLTADKATQQKMLKEQQTRSASLQALKTSIGALESADGEELFDLDALKEYNLPMFEKINRVMTQEDTQITVDPDTQEVYFDLGNGERVFAHDINNIIENDLKPSGAQRDFSAAMVRQGLKGENEQNVEYYDSQEMRATVNAMVTKNNIGNMLYSKEVWHSDGKSFVEVLEKSDSALWNVELQSSFFEHPDIVAMLDQPTHDKEGNITAEPDDVLTQVELDAGDKTNIINFMKDPDNYQIVKDMMVEYGMQRGRIQHQKGTERTAPGKPHNIANNF